MGKTANLELNTTEMSDKISDFVSEYNSNMNMLDDLYGDVQDDASSALSTAQSAETKATAAQTAATNAVTTANSANTTAQSAVSTANSANTTAGQANTKADNAVATANTAKDTADEAKETAETASADVADKADVDGTYDSFTAGGAKQLLSTVYVDDNEPYNFRTAGGSADIGDRMYEEVVGGTVVWNQQCKYSNGSITNNGVTFTRSNGYVTVNGTATGGTSALNSDTQFDGKANHVIYVAGCPSDGAWNKYAFREGYTAGYDVSYDFGDGKIFKKTSTGDKIIGQIVITEGTTVENLVFKPQIIDLTQMFGSTIADYIYSLEQGTAGAGVAWFRKLFPKPYYEYNAGELMSVKAGSHDTVGFNAWDEEWEVGAYTSADGSKINTVTDRIRSKNFIPVIPTATYYVNKGLQIYFYDKDKKYINWEGNVNPWTITMTKDGRDVYYITFNGLANSGTTYNHDICINLSWDGERNGEYEPYEKHTYPLANIELRGIPKLDANNQLYYDGDTYASDGTVTRKYGIVDLGTLNWCYNNTYKYFYFTNFVSTYNCKNFGTVGKQALVSPLYESASNGNQLSDTSIDKIMYVAFHTARYALNIRNLAYTDSASFKSAMSGVYLVYELATPTTETADTFANPQIVDDFGTEEYVDYAVEAGDRDVAIPVGHNSQYMNNLRAKLEMSPDSPSGDGKYIVQQSNGENAYIPYTADGRLDAIEAKLPAPPSANGTYKLTATVSNNGVTYSWQS